MKKDILIVLCFLFARIICIYAVPAYPKMIPIISNGDTIHIQMQGDESCKFAIDENGYTVLASENGWFYAAEDVAGKVRLSSYPVVSMQKMDNATKLFLENTRKGLMPTAINQISRSYSEEEYVMQSNAVGTRKVLVILMQFRDKKFTKEVTDFHRLFNEENYTDDGAIGSVYDYYKWASYGQLHLISDVLGPYTAKHDMSYYGGNSAVGGGDKNPYELFEEAINEAIKEVNLSDYDANCDGYVDNIHIIYAGFGEEAGASSNAIWAHEMTFRPITLQGMKIDRYSCAPELRGNSGIGISRIGPHCHEIGHALGGMDYYDTDYATGGSYLGTGNWDIMASGSWNNDGISPADFNPYVKIYNYGWAEAQAFVADTINSIKPSTEKENIYRIDTGTKNDYYLLENRNGEVFHAAEPGSGLLIFHIGPQLETKAATNTINSSYPQQCYVVCASSTSKKPSSSPSTYGNINSEGCPYPGSSNKHEFGDETIPAALAVNGNASGIQLSDITKVNGRITLFYSDSKQSDTIITDGEVCWQEDFEQMRIPLSWNYSDIVGFGEFTVTTKLSNGGTSQLPEAASGKGYAKFSALKNGIGRHFTRGMLSTPIISLAANKHYQFTIQVRKFATLEDACDSLFINLYDGKGNYIEKLISYDIDSQSKWEQLTAVMPDSVYEFSLGIECNIDYGSIIFIDNLKVMESPNKTGITSVNNLGEVTIHPCPCGISIRAEEDTELQIYNYNGATLYKEYLHKTETKTYNMRSGIYIIRIGKKRIKIRVI